MASSSTTSSIYSDLDTSARQIRLLYLLPALRSSSPIKCELSVTCLNPAEKFPGEHLVYPPTAAIASRPVYEALSYVWGDPSNPVPIKLDGRDITVTRNLHTALLALRSHTKKRTLWVDALCINQDDLQERASQVMLMRFIYEQCNQVLIFLGPGTATTDRGIKFVQDFHDRVVNRSDTDKLMQWILETATKDDLWLTVALDILGTAWWTRSWIFQEILCAPKAVVHCGRKSVPWAAFETMARTINEIEAVLLARQNAGMCIFIAKYLDLYNFVLYRHQRPLSPLTFSEALQTRRKALATDPRDKVFALLGVCKDEMTTAFPPQPPSSHELRVDYKRSLVDIYTGAVKHIVRNSHSLDILAACQNPQRLNGLPSWAPDWTVPRNNNPIMDVDTWGRIHYASGKVPYYGNLIEPFSEVTSDAQSPTPSPKDDDAIVVRGIAFSTVQGIGAPYVGDSEDLEVILSRWQELAILTSRFHPDGTPGKKGERFSSDGSFRCASGVTIKEGFTTTIRVGRKPTVELFSDSESDTDSDNDSQDAERAAARAEEREAREEGAADRAIQRQRAYTAQLQQAFKLAAENRRFFITGRGGFLGLGPVEMELGDVVSVLLGSHVATILRKLPEAGEGQEEYVIVGEAYMHGIMEGELFEEKTRENLELLVGQKLDVREFVLR